MTVKDVFDIINDYSAITTIAVVLLTSMIEVSKVKINPWTALAKGIGKRMNKEIMDKLEIVENDVKNLREKHDNLECRMDRKDADACRARILRFADELRRNVDHSEEFFNQILEDVSNYERYCREHPEYKNSKAVNAIEKINETYKHCIEKNSFL